MFKWLQVMWMRLFMAALGDRLRSDEYAAYRLVVLEREHAERLRVEKERQFADLQIEKEHLERQLKSNQERFEREISEVRTELQKIRKELGVNKND